MLRLEATAHFIPARQPALFQLVLLLRCTLDVTSAEPAGGCMGCEIESDRISGRIVWTERW